MEDLRQDPRIRFKGSGTVTVNGEAIPLETVNLSKGGGCFQTHAQQWQVLEDSDLISGKFTVDEHEVQFEGRVCWSSESEAQVQFGVQFSSWDAHKLEAILIQNDQTESESRQNSFNI